ncbi:MAG: DUF2889 domain-containing protein [Myxococcota bacterium]
MEAEVQGAPLHTRSLGVALRRAEDGDVDAFATISDVRKRGLVAMPGELQTSGVIHDMRIHARLAETPAIVREMRSEQLRVVFEPGPATGGECCRDPADRIGALADTPLDAAHRALGDAIGGPRGCSHVLTLGQLLVSGAQQAFRFPQETEGRRFQPGDRFFVRNLMIDGFVRDGQLQLTLLLDDIHAAPTEDRVLTNPMQRLGRRHEVRARVEIDGERLQLTGVAAAERVHEGGKPAGPWQSRDDDLASLAGAPALGGMAGRLFKLLGEGTEDAPLLDTLLNLAPAVIQVMPAWMYDRQDQAPDASQRDAEEAGARMTTNAMTGACYMWRADGFLGRKG